jgi:hypothetical protein
MRVGDLRGWGVQPCPMRAIVHWMIAECVDPSEPELEPEQELAGSADEEEDLGPDYDPAIKEEANR